MEILLNLVWAGLSFALVWQWLHSDSSQGSNRRAQMIAMFVLITILFPVISVSDDLMFAQNPAETDSLARRNHLAADEQHPAPAIASVPPPAFFGLTFAVLYGATPSQFTTTAADSPALTRIQSRPPPAA